jgi:predicted ester cyclase
MMRRIFDEGFAAGDTSVMDELCPPSLVEHQFGVAATGEQAREHVRAAIRDVHSVFPDISFTTEDSPSTATRSGCGYGRAAPRAARSLGPPGNKPVDITVFDLAHVANSQILEHSGVPDRFALLAQTRVLDRLAP